MKTTLIKYVVLCSVSLILCSCAELYNFAGYATGIGAGCLNQIVENANNITPEQKQTWESLLNEAGFDNRAVSAGNAFWSGDWKKGVSSISGTTAERLGLNGDYFSNAVNDVLNEDYADAGVQIAGVAVDKAGLDGRLVVEGGKKILNHDYSGATVDLMQFATRSSGITYMDSYFDYQRNLNEIERTYRQNISSGMSVADAKKLKIQQSTLVTYNMVNNIVEQHNIAQARKKSITKSLQDRGYSEVESEYMFAVLAESDINAIIDENVLPDDLLNNFNVAYRVTGNNNNNRFFDEIIEEPLVSSTQVLDSLDEVNNSSNAKMLEKEKIIMLINNTVIAGYKFNDTELTDSMKSQLDSLASILVQNNELQVEIYGHTCNIGSAKANYNTGYRRAQSVKTYLISAGVSEARMVIDSKGCKEPYVENDSAIHRSQNRRVQFFVK